MAKMVREGDGTLETGTPRMKMIVITKEDDFAECTFERLDDRIELEPVDMSRMRRAMQAGYRTYKRKRVAEIEAAKEKTEEVAVDNGSTEVLPTPPETEPGDVEDKQGGEDDAVE